MIYDVPLDVLVERQIPVVDTYMSYTHVHATEGDVDFLRAQGYRAEPFAPRIGRAGWSTTDTIPFSLQSLPNTQYWIVEFRGPVKPGWLHAMEATGAVVIEVLPPTGYIVRATQDAKGAVQQAPEVSRVTPYHPAFKLSRSLPWDVAVFNGTAFADRDLDVTATANKIRLTGALVDSHTTSATRHIINIRATPPQVLGVARIDEVFWIAHAPGDEGGIDLNKSASVIQSGQNVVGTHDGNYSIHARNINGSTQRILICDKGLTNIVNDSSTNTFWITHPAFSQASTHTFGVYDPSHRKVLMYYAPTENGVTLGDYKGDYHGDGVAGVAAGDANDHHLWRYLDGIAYDAKLFFCDSWILDTQKFPDDAWNYIQPAYDRGATIASFSQWRNISPAYREDARQRDEIVWLNRNLTITQSIGNEGNSASQRAASVAKSVLSVGQVENQPYEPTMPKDACSSVSSSGDPEKIGVLSNRGPASDGRYKPNVVAPASITFAPDALGNYSCHTGTSFSTPAVAGAAALIRDYFAKGFYPSGSETAGDARGDNVSSALVRAMIMASGKDLDPPNHTNLAFPNQDQGWGRVLLENVLHFSGETRKLLIVDEWESRSPVNPSRNLTSGEVWQRNFTAFGPGDLRVFLAWSDYPATLEGGVASIALVNDLDLEVEGPACATLGPEPDLCIGNAFASGSAETVPSASSPRDLINVEEAVYRCKWPASTGAPCGFNGGTHTVRVRANTTSTPGGQSFALVITGNVSWTA